MSSVRGGWDGPLEIDVRFNLPELASSMQAGYDDSGMGRKTGRLRRALGTLGNYKSELGGKRVRLNINLPYAALRDEGGRIPDRYPRNAKAMKWTTANGTVIFRKFARGYDVQGKRYIEHGFRAFAEKYGGGKDIGINVKWVNKRG